MDARIKSGHDEGVARGEVIRIADALRAPISDSNFKEPRKKSVRSVIASEAIHTFFLCAARWIASLRSQ
jgi:hypothetical protein